MLLFTIFNPFISLVKPILAPQDKNSTAQLTLICNSKGFENGDLIVQTQRECKQRARCPVVISKYRAF